MTKKFKAVLDKCVSAAFKALPAIMSMALLINCNSTASVANGQPKPPTGLKKYRKF